MLCSVRSSVQSARCAGFTLMQALVIVAGLAVIILITFPLFSHGDKRSHRYSCQSNLKQIGLAIMQYCQDADDQYPRLAMFTSSGSVGPSSIVSWRQAIEPYHKSKALFRCPYNPIGAMTNVMDSYPQSYDVVDTGPIRLNQAIKAGDIAGPATTILAFEENGDTPQAQQIGVLWDEDSGETGWTNILYAGHFHTGVYLFCDGHVKTIRPLDTVTGGINCWHLNNGQAVSKRAMTKLQTADTNFANSTDPVGHTKD